MKICIIAPVHKYDDIRVFKKEAISYTHWGHEVVQYSRTPDHKEFLENGIQIKPVVYKSRLQRFLALIPLFFRVYGEKADVYHLHNPDMIPYILVLKCLGEKVIYDTHEDFSKKILLRGWIPKPIRVVVAKLVDVMERLASKISNGMIVTQKEQAQKFKGSFFIGNAPIVSPTSKYPLAKSNEKLELVYLGGISKDRGLAYMLDLLESLNKHRDTKLTLIGFPINDNFLEEAQKLPIWKQVNYLGAMKQEEAFELVAQADFGMVTILDVADYKHTSPNKIYEYMMLGTPFVATNFPAWMEQLDALNSGLFTSVDSVEAQLIEQLIAIKKDTELYQDMAKCGVQYTQNIFNWDITEAPKLAKCLKQL